MEKDENGIESIAEDYRKEPLSEIQEIEPNAGRKSQRPSLMNKVQGKVSELKQRYSSYQSMQKERAKEKAIKEIARAKEERELRLLEKQAATEKATTNEIKQQVKEMNKANGGSGVVGNAITAFRSFQSGRKAAFYGGASSKSGLLSGGLGGGSGLLSQGLGNKSSLLSGGLGGKNKMLMGGLGNKKNALSGGLGKSGMSLSLGKGKGLKL